MSISFSMNRTTRPASANLFKKGVYPPEFNDRFKECIRERDRRTCALCRVTEKNLGHHLDVHHINYTKYTVRVNCISLCRKCHEKVHADSSPAFRAVWGSKLYKIALQREGIKTREELMNAWRNDARNP